MKKPIIVIVIMALTLLGWGFFAPAQPQDTAKEEQPTFYRLIPGVYVNGWPRFTIHYPKDWVEIRCLLPTVFLAVASRPKPWMRSCLSVNIFSTHPNPRSALSKPLPLEKLADVVVPYWRNVAQDVTVVRDKPTRLRDDTPAWEVETKMVYNGEPYNVLNVATKKGDTWVNTGTESYTGKMEEYQRAILYSLQFEPEKDEPVKVPPDIQAFFDKYCSDIVSHDLAKVMANVSDRYLDSGMKKGEVERFTRRFIGGTTSYNVVITELVPGDNRVYLAGFVVANGVKFPLGGMIIKENGEWKWYGNQRDAISDPRFQ
jgi:hypothetical protein